MNKVSFFSIPTIVISTVISASLISCTYTSTPQPLTTPPAPPAATAKKDDDVRIVTFEKPQLKVRINEWWPTEVISINEVEKGLRKGDWLIEIRNVSDRPIKSVEFTLDSPAYCDAFAMGNAAVVGLGEGAPYLTQPTKPTLDPGETDKIVVKREDIAEMIPPKELKSCPPEKSYCFLFIEKVIYADGTQWARKHDPNDPNWKDETNRSEGS